MEFLKLWVAMVNNYYCLFMHNIYCNPICIKVVICVCPSGFSGQYCELFIQNINQTQNQTNTTNTTNPCLNGGTYGQNKRCICTTNYTGEFCQTLSNTRIFNNSMSNST